MEKQVDLEKQPLLQEVEENRKQTNAISVVTTTKRFLEKIYGIKLERRHIPHLLYHVLVLCLITYTCMGLFGTLVDYRESKYDSSLTLTMRKDVIAMEKLTENTTMKISNYLPDQWHHGTYTIGYHGICRQNENSEKVCYRGSKVEELVIQDIGLQIAENQGMDDADQFSQRFTTTYRDLLNSLETELEKRRTCNEVVCTYMGLTNEEVKLFLTKQIPEYWPVHLTWVSLLLAASCFAVINCQLRTNNSVLADMNWICTVLQATLSICTIMTTSQTMSLIDTYFKNRFLCSILFFIFYKYLSRWLC